MYNEFRILCSYNIILKICFIYFLVLKFSYNLSRFCSVLVIRLLIYVRCCLGCKYLKYKK